MTKITDMWRLHRLVTGTAAVLQEDYQALDLFEGFEQVDACNMLLTDLEALEGQAADLADLAHSVVSYARLSGNVQAALDEGDGRSVLAAAREARRVADHLQTEIRRWHNI